MKKISACMKYHKYISDEDYDILKQVSPALAKTAKKSDFPSPTHFVCLNCGQVAPVKLRSMHNCGTEN